MRSQAAGHPAFLTQQTRTRHKQGVGRGLRRLSASENQEDGQHKKTDEMCSPYKGFFLPTSWGIMVGQMRLSEVVIPKMSVRIPLTLRNRNSLHQMTVSLGSFPNERDLCCKLCTCPRFLLMFPITGNHVGHPDNSHGNVSLQSTAENSKRKPGFN
jgi:hypothetical protein